tara:strand:- start:63 stop:221 length:159 start_codon:yes stop_codon:yes gene_type:complete
MDYKIIGPLRVADKDPGEIVTLEDLAGSNISALVEAGHIQPIKSKPSKEESE